MTTNKMGRTNNKHFTYLHFWFFPSATMEAKELMRYTTSHHQGAIKIFLFFISFSFQSKVWIN